MSIDDLLARGAISTGVRAANKKALFLQMAERLGPRVGIAAKLIADSLGAREERGATGFSGGVAIPHGRLPGLAAPFGAIALMETPLEYEALDNAPVDLVFILLTASERGAEHLKTLAMVSRALRDRALVAKIRGAGSPDAIRAILGEAPQTRAA